MAELADAAVLGAATYGEIRAGSSPVTRTSLSVHNGF